MDESDITHEQARQLHERLYASLNFLTRLRERMERRGFLPDDPLYALVAESQDAVFRLRMHLHYLACASGVGQAPRTTPFVSSD
jgi:hypothetical protein